MDSLLSFPVGLFHPLQHAGLSRRTRYTDYASTERFVKPTALLASNSRVLTRKMPTQTAIYIQITNDV